DRPGLADAARPSGGGPRLGAARLRGPGPSGHEPPPAVAAGRPVLLPSGADVLAPLARGAGPAWPAGGAALRPVGQPRGLVPARAPAGRAVLARRAAGGGALDAGLAGAGGAGRLPAQPPPLARLDPPAGAVPVPLGERTAPGPPLHSPFPLPLGA